MISIKTFTVLLCLISYVKCERVRLHAKELIRGKVIGNGYSVTAKSLSQCIEHCNKYRVNCDGVVYHDIIGKCRLIRKCAPAFQVDNSSSSVYYSRRPQIKVPGYVHDPKSDSCLGLITTTTDYASADSLCAEQNARLAILTEKSINDLAARMLSSANVTWTWIEEKNVANVGQTIKPHGMSGNDVLSKEIFSPEVVQWRNISSRSCWGLNNFGQWGQFSCKNDTMSALCQVPQFKV